MGQESIEKRLPPNVKTHARAELSRSTQLIEVLTISNQENAGHLG
jgi:hypothetical protein